MLAKGTQTNTGIYQIGILRDGNGKPFIRLYLDKYNINLSFSHYGNYACCANAIVIER